MDADIGNALFELFACGFILNHCRVLHQDKAVRGVSLLSTVFFATWGGWNVFYYPHLGQLWSFAAGLLVFAANLLWIGLMFRYRRA